MHDAKVTDIKIRTFIGNSMEISPIVVSAAEDGSVKIWFEGGRMFDCDGLKFKVIKLSNILIFLKFRFHLNITTTYFVWLNKLWKATVGV